MSSILLYTPFSKLTVKINGNETPRSLTQKMMQYLNWNFRYRLQETQTGRFLPDDEILLPEREYYLTPF